MLSKKTCVPCQGGIPPLKDAAIKNFLIHLDNDWEVLESKKLRKEFVFPTYMEAIDFVNNIAALAEDEAHHPYIHINYKTVILIIFTHKISGLHENDFILAAKCDLTYVSLS